MCHILIRKQLLNNAVNHSNHMFQKYYHLVHIYIYFYYTQGIFKFKSC